MKWRKWLAGSGKVFVEKLEGGHSAMTEWKRLHAMKIVSRTAQEHIQKTLHFSLKCREGSIGSRR